MKASGKGKDDKSQYHSNGISKSKQISMPRRHAGQDAYRIYMPIQWLVVIAVFTSAVAFLLGKAARSHLDPAVVKNQDMGLLTSLKSKIFRQYDQASNDNDVDGTCSAVYSASEWSLSNVGEIGQIETEEEEGDDDDNGQEPKGCHLLMDFQGVDTGRLQSEEHFKESMLRLVEQLGVFDLRNIYSRRTRHGNLIAGGISDAHDHVWLWAWPKEEVVFLDLFSSADSNDFMRFVPEIERFFKGQKNESPEKAVHWSYKSRGFEGTQSESDKNAVSDLFWFPLGVMLDQKVEVRSMCIQCVCVRWQWNTSYPLGN
jgi:hypothetical protein